MNKIPKRGMDFCRTMDVHDEIGTLLLGVICAYTNRHARIVFKKTIAQNMGVANIFFFLGVLLRNLYSCGKRPFK